MNTLNVKLSVLIGLLSFLIALGVGKYSNDISTKQLEQNSGDALIKLSKRVADILDREMLERYREIKFAATLPTMTNENSTKEEIRTLIEKIKGDYNHHEWIGYALPDGTVFAGTNGYLEGKNAKARPWHPGGLKGPYIGDVHDALLLAKLLPNTSGEAIYFSDVAFPVKNKNGDVLGVLCTHLMWQWTRDVIRSIAKENSVDIFLLSKDGLVLVGPGNSERKDIKEISNNVAKTFNNDNTTYKLLDWEPSETYLTAYTVSKGFEEYKGFNWKVIVRQPVNDAFAIAQNNSKNILFASIIAGILGALVGLISANRISFPLRKLTKNVEKLKQGEDAKFEKSASTDEVGILQNALINLHDSLGKESKLKEQAEEKVQISLKIFDQSIEGILISDANNRVILTNKAFSEITEYSQEDMYGQNPKILSSGNNNQEFYTQLWNILLTKGKWEGEIENRKKGGDLYTEQLRISTLKDSNGKIVYYLATFNSSF